MPNLDKATQAAHQAVRTASLERSQLGEATVVLTDSFQDAPQFVAVCPDPTLRKTMLHIFLRVALTDAFKHGRVRIALLGERIVGVALWLSPGHEVMTPSRQARAALPMLRLLLMAPRPFFGLSKLGATLSASHPQEPHWYLVALGVCAELQGQGIGSGLVREGIAHAKRTGHALYLETMLERNVQLYKKHGFRVLHRKEGILPGGPPFWFMWRAGAEGMAALEKDKRPL